MGGPGSSATGVPRPFGPAVSCPGEPCRAGSRSSPPGREPRGGWAELSRAERSNAEEPGGGGGRGLRAPLPLGVAPPRRLQPLR